MKKLLTTLMLIMSGMFFSQCNSQNFRSLNADDFEKAIQSPDIIVLDSRTAQEYADGHIRNAVNIDVKNADFEQKAVESLDKTKTIAVYCRSGRRSKIAAAILSKNGFTVIELDCGITCWASAGKEVVK
ncbi:MAG: rhodanese-like domain-containing protein [Bacteroidales bacterium]|nr:rhodanese-like domain-containing protein [Bacteroidales bacterium]